VIHQPRQAACRPVLPRDVDQKPFPAFTLSDGDGEKAAVYAAAAVGRTCGLLLNAGASHGL
jgi:hypothetical protein